MEPPYFSSQARLSLNFEGRNMCSNVSGAKSGRKSVTAEVDRRVIPYCYSGARKSC